MGRHYIVRRRQNTILYTEVLLTSLITAILSVIYIPLHPAIGLIVAIVSLLLFAFLFFTFSIFRYIFSILFSLVWAAVFYLIGRKFDHASDTTACVFAIIAFCFCIWAHWDHFRFLKNAKVYEYEQ